MLLHAKGEAAVWSLQQFFDVESTFEGVEFGHNASPSDSDDDEGEFETMWARAQVQQATEVGCALVFVPDEDPRGCVHEEAVGSSSDSDDELEGSEAGCPEFQVVQAQMDAELEHTTVRGGFEWEPTAAIENLRRARGLEGAAAAGPASALLAGAGVPSLGRPDAEQGRWR